LEDRNDDVMPSSLRLFWSNSTPSSDNPQPFSATTADTVPIERKIMSLFLDAIITRGTDTDLFLYLNEGKGLDEHWEMLTSRRMLYIIVGRYGWIQSMSESQEFVSILFGDDDAFRM